MNVTEKYKRSLQYNRESYKRKKNKKTISRDERLWIWDKLHDIPMTGPAHSKAVLDNLRKEYKKLAQKNN